jgi:hypothetical protein
MKTVRTAVCLLWIAAIGVLPHNLLVIAQDVKTSLILESSDWKDALDNLFGVPDNGLLDGSGNFEFRAEHVALTSEESADFFATEHSETRLAELVRSALSLEGAVHVQGTIEGQPFELSLGDRKLNVEGVALTSEQLDILAAGLASIDDLREMRIGALVDGKVTIVRFEGDDSLRIIEKTIPGELAAEPSAAVPDIDAAKPFRVGLDRPILPEREARPERVERIEKPESVRVDKVEKIEKVEKPAKIERFEKPERPEGRGRRD